MPKDYNRGLLQFWSDESQESPQQLRYQCLRRIRAFSCPRNWRSASLNLEAGEQISPEVLGKMYAKYNTDAKVLSIIHKDECIELTDNFNYILINKNHYSLVTKFMPKNVNRGKYKRALLAFDFETRKVSTLITPWLVTQSPITSKMQSASCLQRSQAAKPQPCNLYLLSGKRDVGPAFLDWLKDACGRKAFHLHCAQWI